MSQQPQEPRSVPEPPGAQEATRSTDALSASNVGTEAGAVPAAEPTATQVGPGQGGRVTLRSRTGGLWVVLVAAAVVLVLLLVFVLQNQQRVQISFFAAEGSLPLGVALLFAAIAGVLIVAIPGTGRILQLRRAARRRQP